MEWLKQDNGTYTLIVNNNTIAKGIKKEDIPTVEEMVRKMMKRGGK